MVVQEKKKEVQKKGKEANSPCQNDKKILFARHTDKGDLCSFT